MPRKFQVVTPSPDTFSEREAFTFNEAWNLRLYMVERRHPTKDQPTDFIYGSSNLDKARVKFNEMVRFRPGGRWILRQRARALMKWPEDTW